MKREGRPNLRKDEEYLSLARYASTLKKESMLDRDERAGVELSVVSSMRKRMSNFNVAKGQG